MLSVQAALREIGINVIHDLFHARALLCHW
jgi:hypothetical protein